MDKNDLTYVFAKEHVIRVSNLLSLMIPKAIEYWFVPIDGSGECNERWEKLDQIIVACGDAAKLLDPTEDHSTMFRIYTERNGC